MLLYHTDIHYARQRVDELNHEAWQSYLHHDVDALYAAREAEQLAREAGYIIGCADALQNQARCARVWADFRKSAELSRQAYELYEQANHRSGMADALSNMAFMHINLEEYERALPLAVRAEQLANRSNHVAVQSFACLVKGMACEHLSQFDRALHNHRRALDYSRSAQDEIGAASALLNIGIVMRKTGRLSSAMEYVNEAEHIFARHNILLLMASAKYYQAQLQEDSDELDRAFELLQDALAMVKKIRHAQGQGPLYLRMGAVRRKQLRYEEAEEYLLQSVELSRSYGKHQAECKGLLELALGYLARNKIPQAIATLDDALATAEFHGLAGMQHMLQRHLGQAYAAKGQWRQAFLAMERAAQLQQELSRRYRSLASMLQ
ncbi:MAG: tetratricopeptide repeat protein [Chitinophagales bacterium]|nr:tetratricopeptide repeat protein [Chitinophagales bacterium]MDW8393903.1 tetratricopeptide repeat protein [Chitinophagales bacterium]